MAAVTECPSCEARLDLKTRERIGKRVRCPRCKEVFTARLVGSSGARRQPAKSAAQSSRPSRPSRPAPARSTRSAPPPRSKKRGSVGSKKKRARKTELKPQLIAGGIGFVVLMIAPILYTQFRASGSTDIAGSGSESSATNTGTGAPAEVVPLVSEPISEEEAVSFAKRLRNSVKGGDNGSVDMFLNIRGIVERGIENVDVPSNVKRQFLSGVAQGAGQLGSQIINAVKAGGSYEIVNHRAVDGRRQVLFRLKSEDGVNYHLLDLTKGQNGRIAAGDLFISLTGEHVSAATRRVFVALASSANRSLVDRLLGNEQLLVKHWSTVQKAQQAFNRGSYESGMQPYQQLPQELQNEKFLLISRIRAAAAKGVDSREYEASLKAFRDAHPNGLAANAMGIDYFLLKKDYAQSLAAIQVLDDFAQGDPYLNVMRAGVTLASGDTEGAGDLLEPLLDDPIFAKDALVLYLDVVMALNNHRATLETLLALESDHGMQFPRDLSTVPGFQTFAQSPEHAKFRNR